MNRRGFFGFLGLGAAAAASPNVKQTEALPLSKNATETFAGGYLKYPVDWSAALRPAMWDVRDGMLYDRIRFEAGASLPSTFRFFCTPVGSPCPYTNVLKTFRHTNLFSHGYLEPPRYFLARDLIFAVHPSAAEIDLDLFSAEAYWEFRLSQKVIAGGPMLLNGPARAGLRDIVTEEGRPKDPLPAAVEAAAYHQPVTGGTLIPGQCNFGVQISFPNWAALTLPSAGGRGVDLLVGFRGLDARGVQ